MGGRDASRIPAARHPKPTYHIRQSQPADLPHQISIRTVVVASCKPLFEIRIENRTFLPLTAGGPHGAYNARTPCSGPRTGSSVPQVRKGGTKPDHHEPGHTEKTTPAMSNRKTTPLSVGPSDTIAVTCHNNSSFCNCSIVSSGSTPTSFNRS